MRVLGLLLVICIPAFADSAVSLGGLYPGLSQSNVIALKGKPISHMGDADYITDTFLYSDMEVYFNGNEVVGVYTKSKAICTAQGVCFGDNLEKAKLLYGTATQKEEGLFEFYNHLESDCWYSFRAEKSVITAIEIACQP